MSGKLRQAVRWATNREGGGCLLLDDQCTKTRRTVAEVIWEKHPDMRVPPMENPPCAAFEEYREVPETVPLDFTEDDVMWVASKLSGAAGELRNWLLCFGCASEDLRVVVARLYDWMVNPPPPAGTRHSSPPPLWAAYRALMACRLVALDKMPGVHPVGIGEIIRRARAKLVMREAGDQAKTMCGNLKLCAGLEAVIEGATQAVG